MIQIDMQMPSNCYDCWIRQNMGCHIANDSGWLNDRRDDNCPLKAQEPMQIIKVGYPDHGRCPKCGRYVSKYSNFCWYCGQAVKWE